MSDFANYDNTNNEDSLLATDSSHGLMSSSDKTKLDSLFEMWVGTQTEYDQLPTKNENILYIIKEG